MLFMINSNVNTPRLYSQSLRDCSGECIVSPSHARGIVCQKRPHRLVHAQEDYPLKGCTQPYIHSVIDGDVSIILMAWNSSTEVISTATVSGGNGTCTMHNASQYFASYSKNFTSVPNCWVCRVKHITDIFIVDILRPEAPFINMD